MSCAQESARATSRTSASARRRSGTSAAARSKRKSRRRRGREARRGFRVAREQVEPRREALHAVDEEGEVDPRRERQRVPRRVRPRERPGEDPEEAVAREDRLAVERLRAPPRPDHGARVPGRAARGRRGPREGGRPRRGEARAARRRRGLPDHRPVLVVGRENIRGPPPRCRGSRGGPFGPERGRRHGGDQLRLLALARLREVLVAGKAEQRRDVVVGPAGEDAEVPAQKRRREAQRGQRVAGVVLAVPERALAVLPRLAPGDRRKPDEEPLGERPLLEDGALHEGVVVGPIVEDAGPGRDASHGRQDHVALGRVEVPRGRVHAERPPAAAGHLPRRDGERVVEEVGDRLDRERRGRRGRGAVEVVVREPRRERPARQRHGPRAREAAERLGLGVPVEVPERRRVAPQVVLRPFVVPEDRLH